MKKLFNSANILFILALIVGLLPSGGTHNEKVYFLMLVIFVEIMLILLRMMHKHADKIVEVNDVGSIVFVILLLWEIFTATLNLLDKALFPTPGLVIRLFLMDVPELLKDLFSSMQLLFSGYLLAIMTAIPLGLFVGWRKRLYRAVAPFCKVFGPIPPIVYIPYAIGILPTFKTASVFIIFIGAFWPIFINTLTGVQNTEKKLIDSAKSLQMNEGRILFYVILPAALPSIFAGATIALVMSFIMLTAAEMIGATSGLGWYVKYFSDFADYPRVIVGIIFIGFVVTMLMTILDRAEKYLLRWKA